MNLVDIKEYEGLYSFDLNTNKIWSYDKNAYKSPDKNQQGYLNIWLWKNNKRKSFRLHRLVYQYNNLDIDISNLIIDHKDRNRENNNLDNLRVATKSENCCNRKTPIHNKLGIKNIKKNGKNYLVRITKNKIVYHHSFEKLEDAIEWRDSKLREIHNDFSSIS